MATEPTTARQPAPAPARGRLRSAPSHVGGFARWLRHVRRHGKPERVLYFDGGLGDQLLCGNVARELQRRRARNLWLFTYAPEMFAANDDFSAVMAHDWWLVPWLRLSGSPVQRLSYQDYLGDGRDAPLQEHLIAALCRRAGLTGEVTLRPWLPGVARSRAAHSGGRPVIAVQSSCLSGRYPMPNKQWPVERMQAVVDQLVARADVIHVGGVDDPPLRGAVDRRGEPFMATARLLAGVDLFAGLVGFLMHLSRAVECPAVIIYGGREPAALTGYRCNQNIETPMPCAPCWSYSHCDLQRRCLTDISVDAVLRAIDSALGRPSSPLPEDRVLL